MSLPESLQRTLRLPVVGAPLFIISNPTMVIEQCKAGIIGSLTRNHCRDTQEECAR